MSGRRNKRSGNNNNGRDNNSNKNQGGKSKTPQTPILTDPPIPNPLKHTPSGASLHSAPLSAYDTRTPDNAAATRSTNAADISLTLLDDGESENVVNVITPKDPAQPEKIPLPPTPKSPSPQPLPDVPEAIISPTSKGKDRQIPSASLARPADATKDVEAVRDVLQSMKSTCKVLGSTFEVLGEQTMRVAALGPAIDAKRQISSARKSMDEQFKRQEERMLEVKTMLKDKLLDETFKGHMRDVVSEIVAEIVKREIAERVRIQLQEQIPQAMRDQVVEYQQKILEVKTSLYNSEARRHNALIQSNSLDEPLKPLLRPMQSTVNSPAPVSSIPKGSAVSAKPTSPPPKSSSPKATTTKKTTPNTPAAAETDAPDTSALSIQVEDSSTVGSTNTGRPVRPRVVTDLAPPTPSPFFPRDLTTLLKLGDNETKTLMQDYGLVPMRHPGTPLAQEGEAASAGLAAPDEQLEGSREENLNKFLNHIGVGFQLVPSPTGGKAPPTPFVTMMAH